MSIRKMLTNLISVEGRYLLMIFVLAVILRLTYLILMLSQIGINGLYDQYTDPAKYLGAADYLMGRNQAGQYDLFLVGIGYPAILATNLILFGRNFLPLILVQIIFSGITCVIIYKIGELLTGNRAIALLSGILATVSLTSISLANALSTEAIFFFLLCYSYYLFLKGAGETGLKNSILAGVLGGFSILVRSVTSYFPGVLIASAFLVPVGIRTRRQVILRSSVIALIMLFIPSVWGLRNLVTHEIFTISGTGALAAKTYLSSKVLIEAEGRHIRDFPELRDSLYRASLDRFYGGDYRENQEDNLAMVKTVAQKYPATFIKTYFATIWENITVVSSLQYLQLPDFRSLFEDIDYYWNRGANNPFLLVLVILGFFVISRKNLAVALILSLPVLYFAFVSGITFAQGSRIFFPAQCTELILASAALIFMYKLVQEGVVRFIGRQSNRSESR